jgi:tetratricopeptide (TPR) repeat protein
MKQDDVADALADFQQAAARAPQSAGVLADRAIAFWRSQLADQAACRRRGRSPTDCDLGAGLSRATGYFDEVLSIDPNNVPALYGRGSVNLAGGHRDLAEADWRKALGIAPSDPGLRTAMTKAGMRLN